MYKKVKNPWIGKEGYKCFGCAPDNPIGLHLEFYAADNETLWCEWMPGEYYQGWIGVLHGGIQALIVDEAGEWWLNYFHQAVGVTAKMEIKYHKSVLFADCPLRIKTTHIKDVRNYVYMKMELFNAKEELCSSAEVVYYQQPKEYAQTVLGFKGCELE